MIRKSKKYFQDKVRIDKAVNKKTAYKIQAYNNYKIDELVKAYNNDEPIVKQSSSMLSVDLAILNKPEVFKNYNHIINSKYTSDDAINKILTKNKANKDLERIVEAEVNRISKNLEYAEQILKKYEVPQKMYEEYKAKQANKSLANRQQILKDVAIQANELLVSEGLNIPSNVFSYRNLDATAENLLRQSQMASKHEEINQINDNYINEGKDAVYNSKEWIWTGEGKTTRHASNDHQVRKVNEPFIITNDETLEIDELMYPSDPAGSPSNTFICYCDVEYLTGDVEDKDLLQLDTTLLNPNTDPITSFEPPTTDSALKTVAFGNASEILEALTPKPVGEYIDASNLTHSDVTSTYYVHKAEGLEYDPITDTYSFKGMEVTDINETGNIGKFTDAELAKHNSQFSTEKLTIDDLLNNTKNFENEVKKETEIFESKKEPIDTSQLMPNSEGGYFVDKMFASGKDIKFNNITGKYEYKGLTIENYDPTFEVGTISQAEIDKHNKSLGFEPIKKEAIDTDSIVYDYNTDNYLIDPTLLVKDEISGEHYFNGLKVELIDSYGMKAGVVSKTELNAHNELFGVEANQKHIYTPHSTEKPLFLKAEFIDVSFDENIKSKGDYYEITGKDIHFNYETGKYEYKGLPLKDYNPNTNIGTVSSENLMSFNLKFNEYGQFIGDYINVEEVAVKTDGNYVFFDENKSNIKYSSITGEYYLNGLMVEPVGNSGLFKAEKGELQFHNYLFDPSYDINLHNLIKTNNVYIDSIDSIKTIKIGDEILFEDKETGKQYIYDKDGKYEKAQDNEQYKVKYDNNERNSTEHWGAYGHQRINGLIYRVKRLRYDGSVKQDYSYYGKYMDKLTPIYDELQKLAVDYNKGKITEEKYNKQSDKLIDEAGKIIDRVEDPNNESRLDPKIIKDSMWEIIYMDRAVEKSPELLQDTFFVRFGKFDPSWLKVGKRVKYDGYSSTTYEAEAASHFESKMAEDPNKWAILILADEGSNGVRLNRQFNAATWEREWMLTRNQEFDVLEFNEETHTVLIKLVN